MKKLRVGIIGCGVIGGEIARACVGMLKDKIELAGICDIDTRKAARLKETLHESVRVLDLKELIKECDLLVESASANVSGHILGEAIKNKKEVLIMSVGGLLGNERLLEEAVKKDIKVYLPSGAICGVDGLKAASIGEVRSVTITTRKPPRGLEGAPYIKEKGIDLSKIVSETVIFEGSAEEAVKGFPQNINVCAVLSLAGIGARRTQVKIATSPDYTKNTHEVEISGDSGRIVTKTENMPSKANPKTSALAVLSAIAALKGMTDSVRIGT